MAAKTYYHGGAQIYQRLRPGRGIDGIGIYLTTNLNRAIMYGSRGVDGKDREPFITVVEVDLDKWRYWDNQAKYNIKFFSEAAPFIDKLVADYGPEAVNMNGSGALLFMFGDPNTTDRNDILRDKYGMMAIKSDPDLIVLEPGIIKYVDGFSAAPGNVPTKYVPELLAPRR
jgi:hypothetical protein